MMENVKGRIRGLVVHHILWINDFGRGRTRCGMSLGNLATKIVTDDVSCMTCLVAEARR